MSEQENIIDFAERLLNRDPMENLPLTDDTPSSHKWKGCRHFKVGLDRQSHIVICKDCKKELDPFWYLTLLADEWMHRAYADQRVLKAHADLKQSELNAQAKGKWYTRPDDAPKANAWDRFTRAVGREPDCMWKQRSQWMARYNDVEGEGSTKVIGPNGTSTYAIYSLEYAQMLAAERERHA